MATGKKPAKAKPSSSGTKPGTVRAVAGSVADGYRFVRTREPGFIAGAAPVSLYTAAVTSGPSKLADLTPALVDPVSRVIDSWVVGGGAGDFTSPWSLTVASIAGGCAVRYYRSSDHAVRNREMRRIGRALVGFGIAEPDGQEPRMKNFVRTPAGRRVDVRVPRRSAALKFDAFLPAIEDALGAVVRLDQIPTPHFGPVAAASAALGRARQKVPSKGSPGAGPVKALMPRGGVRLTIVERDTLAEPLTSRWPVLNPGPDGRIPARRWYDPVPVGMDEDGEVVTFSWETTPSLLISGESGAGKSVGTHELVSAWVLDPLAESALWDGKGELELVDYARLAVGLAGPDADRATGLAHMMRIELERRLGLLKDLGLKKAGRDDPRFPPLLLPVEEFTAYTANREFLALLQYLLVRIRAVNMRMLLTTQRPSAQIIGTDIRDNVSARWAFRMNTHASSDMCLGPGWATNGWSAMSIPAGDSHKGVSLLLHDGGSPRRLRTWYSGDDMPGTVAARALDLRGLDPDRSPLGAAAFLSADELESAPAPMAAVELAKSAEPEPPALRVVSPAKPIPDAARETHNATQFVARTRRRPPRAGRAASPVPPGKE